MKYFFTSVFIILFHISHTNAQTFPNYYEQNSFGLTSAGAMKFGLYGLDNPAVLSTISQPDFYFTWDDRTGDWNDLNNWGMFLAFPNFGFNVIHQDNNFYSVNDWRLSFAGGSPAFSFGSAINWSSGNTEEYGRSTVFSFGTLIRPMKYLSVGLVGNFPTSGYSEGVVDVGIRPFGNEKVTVFGDAVFRTKEFDYQNKWSAGIAVEAIEGFRLVGRYFENKYFTIGVQMSFGRAGITAQSQFDEDGNHSYNTYGIRLGAYDRNLLSGISKNKDYVKFDMNGGMKYQQYRWFDDSKTLIDMLAQIDAAEKDESVSGIVMNLSGMNINKEMIWEVSEKLKKFKSKGKKIVVYIDRGGMDEYYLASFADKVVLDPLGNLFLRGYIFGRQYFKGTLNKLGIGFREMRFFKYKSAAETFANDRMSEADREQWQGIVDAWYETAKSEISRNRNISKDDFENIINKEALLMPDDALRLSLVDTLARWDSMNDIINKMEKENKRFVSTASLTEFNLPEDNYWGNKPEIAVIYAIGECAMDEGIKARELVHYVEHAVNNSNIKAIILRVDSPGGDGLASDYISEALKKGKGKKPIIVTQGYVAGSGGYWLSMYGDTIISSPLTITGSIGVIGSYFYNKSFKEELGMSLDYVKRGDYADFGFGIRLPFVGISLPDKDLKDEEAAKWESAIKNSYKDFVNKVADGRNMTYDEVNEVAQGRVWSGIDAKDKNLVDILGGLDDAIKLAKKLTGLKDDEYKIAQYPPQPLFDLNRFTPKLFGIDIKNEIDPAVEDLKFRLENNGKIMPIMPMSDVYFEMK